MNIITLSWEDTLQVRHQVLWPNKPLSFCKVEGDEAATHYGAVINNELVSVASIYIDQRKARLRKFATLPAFQGQGIGSKIINHILAELKQTNVEYFWFDARTSAISFYENFGFKKQGAEFFKSDISYYKMDIELA